MAKTNRVPGLLIPVIASLCVRVTPDRHAIQVDVDTDELSLERQNSTDVGQSSLHVYDRGGAQNPKWLMERIDVAKIFEDGSAKSFSASDAMTPASKKWKQGGYLNCCCLQGACTEGKKGAAGFPEVSIGARCCKEKRKSCSYSESQSDASMCEPPGKGFRLARMCWSGWHTTVHEWLDIDSGCDEFIQTNGSLTNGDEYEARDCPFADSSNQSEMRRSILKGAHESRSIAYSDLALSCKYTQGNGLALDISGEAWSFLNEGRIKAFRDSMNDKEFDAFLCETLRLLPLIFGRIGFRDWGITLDRLHDRAYPSTVRGQMKKDNEPTKRYECLYYAHFSPSQTLRARRVIRAMLPTYGLHVFAQSVYGMWVKSRRLGDGDSYPQVFQDQIQAVCAVESSDAAMVSAAAWGSLVNQAVLRRDTNDDAPCKKTFPCRFTQPGCRQDCECACAKAICWSFVEDFRKAVTDNQCIPLKLQDQHWP